MELEKSKDHFLRNLKSEVKTGFSGKSLGRLMMFNWRGPFQSQVKIVGGTPL